MIIESLYRLKLPWARALGYDYSDMFEALNRLLQNRELRLIEYIFGLYSFYEYPIPIIIS